MSFSGWTNNYFLGIFTLVHVTQYIAAIAVLIAWLPATNCCLIGTITPSAELEVCCVDAEKSQNHGLPCENCVMCSLESGDVLPYGSDFFAANFKDFLLWGKLSLGGSLYSFEVVDIVSGRAPPDLVSWHFNIRNALPGRSPSIILL